MRRKKNIASCWMVFAIGQLLVSEVSTYELNQTIFWASLVISQVWAASDA